MNKRNTLPSFILNILLVTVMSACSSDSGNSNNNAENQGNTSTDFNSSKRTLSHDGIDREYYIHFPSSYDSTTAIPMLFNFHGYGGSSDGHLITADMRAQANSGNFILIYPQGTVLSGGETHWNASSAGGDNKSTADDIGFISALIDDLNANYLIDTARIYAIGYSNGGFFSYFLGCQLSDKIAAVGSVSGTMLDGSYNNCNASHPTAMINIHGTNDRVVDYTGGTGYTSIANVLTFWKDYNVISDAPTIEDYNDNGTTIERHTYGNGTNGASIIHYKVTGGGHIWFSNSYKGATMNQLIWDFFSQFNKDGRI